MKASQGFPPAQDVGPCFSGAGKVEDIAACVFSLVEIPYAQSIPNFPMIKNVRLILSFLQMDETPPGQHVSTWFPAFLDSHAYMH